VQREESVREGARQALLLVLLDVQQTQGGPQLLQVLRQRGDHRQHAGRPQHPCELGGVPRGEDGGEHVEPGVDDWKGAPRISDPGRQPRA